MAPGTNRLPHPPVTLEIELLDKPTLAETPLFSKFGGIVFCGKIFGYQIIYAVTYSREAESESGWLLNPILFSLVSQPSYGLITQKKGTSTKTFCSSENISPSP